MTIHKRPYRAAVDREEAAARELQRLFALAQRS
jgi:hypothetical protein